MIEIKADTVVRRVELLGSRAQEEMLFFDPQAGRYYATGPVGADIWDLIETPRSFEAICDHLIDTYTIDRATCETEVRGFLLQMLDAGIIAAQ